MRAITYVLGLVAASSHAIGLAAAGSPTPSGGALRARPKQHDRARAPATAPRAAAVPPLPPVLPSVAEAATRGAVASMKDKAVVITPSLTYTVEHKLRATGGWQEIGVVCRAHASLPQAATVTAQAKQAAAIVGIGQCKSADASCAEVHPAPGRVYGSATMASIHDMGPDGCSHVFASVVRGASDGDRPLEEIDVAFTIAMRSSIAESTRAAPAWINGSGLADGANDDGGAGRAPVDLAAVGGATAVFYAEHEREAPRKAALRMQTVGAVEAGRTELHVLVADTASGCHNHKQAATNGLNITGATDAAGNALAGGCGPDVDHCCHTTFTAESATDYIDVHVTNITIDGDASLSATVGALLVRPGESAESPLPFLPSSATWRTDAMIVDPASATTYYAAMPPSVDVADLYASSVQDGADPLVRPASAFVKLGPMVLPNGTVEPCDSARYGQTLTRCAPGGPQPSVTIGTSVGEGLTPDAFVSFQAHATVRGPLVSGSAAAPRRDAEAVRAGPAGMVQDIGRTELKALNVLDAVLAADSTIKVGYFQQDQPLVFRAQLESPFPSQPITVAVVSDSNIGLSFGVYAGDSSIPVAGDGSRYQDGLVHIEDFPGSEVTIVVSAYAGIEESGGAVEEAGIRAVVWSGAWGASPSASASASAV